MSIENRDIPDWAGQERQHDLEWIHENAGLFQLAAAMAFEETGRGAIVVDTTIQPLPDAGNPFGYLAQETVQEDLDEDTRRMVREYEPAQEFVLVLLKSVNRTSTYRIQAQPAGHGGADRE